MDRLGWRLGRNAVITTLVNNFDRLRGRRQMTARSGPLSSMSARRGNRCRVVLNSVALGLQRRYMDSSFGGEIEGEKSE